VQRTWSGRSCLECDGLCIAFRRDLRFGNAQGSPDYRAIRGSDPLIDEVTIGGGCDAHADPKETIKGDTRVASPVPAEDEFVEVALDMGRAQSVEDALGRRFKSCPRKLEDPIEDGRTRRLGFRSWHFHVAKARHAPDIHSNNWRRETVTPSRMALATHGGCAPPKPLKIYNNTKNIVPP
jgi:hypothetical protein